MSVAPTSMISPCPTRQWTDPAGRRWYARLISYPLAPADEYEIQIDGEGRVPERILCFGTVPRRFPALSVENLELIRRAARARSGILWLDPRDGELWWVDQGRPDATRWQITYSSSRWTGSARANQPFPLTLFDNTEHQRLLDHARAAAPRRTA